jgi:LmbE family N-acetylglucosaminyl deacetylase
MQGRRDRSGIVRGAAAALAVAMMGAGWAEAADEAARGPVLIIAPHPDDETLGCGGLIAQRRSEGRRVVVVVLTDGRGLLERLGILTDPTPEEVARLRKEETRRAVKILGGDPADLRFLDFENGRLVEQKKEAVAKVAAVLKEVAPAEVYVTGPLEVHPEHVAANAIACEARAASGVNPAIWEYTVSLKSGLPPESQPRRRLEVDVSAHRAREKEALAQFRSHLGTLSPRQTKPLREDFDKYLTPVETFLAGGCAGP